jgi:hypothetical protein
LQHKHTIQVQKVLSIIEEVAFQMDQEEVEIQKHVVALRTKEAAEREKLEDEKFQELQRRVEQQKQQRTTSVSLGNVELSALSKLQLLRPTEPSPERIRRDQSGEEPGITGSSSSTQYRLLDDDETKSIEVLYSYQKNIHSLVYSLKLCR